MDKRDFARSGKFPPMETILRRPARPRKRGGGLNGTETNTHFDGQEPQ
jgi:hypothetical protein